MSKNEEYPYLMTLGLGNPSVTYRPSIQIEIQKNGRSILAMGIIDSGSDMTLVNAEIAIYLGIDMHTCTRVNLGGITGKSAGYVSEVEVLIDRFPKALAMPVVFVEELNTGILLGQTGFFEHFLVTFDRRKKAFSLKRNTHN